MKFRSTTTLVLFSALLVLQSCGKQKTEPKEDQNLAVLEEELTVLNAKQMQTNDYTLGPMEEREFATVVPTSGRIDVPPQNKAVVSAPLGGFVQSTNLLVGDQVKKGQALLYLQNQEFVTLQQEYLEIFQQLNYLKAEYQRQETLFNEQIASQKNYLLAKSKYDRALAEYQGLKKRLQMLRVSTHKIEAGTISNLLPLYAPIKGSITKMAISKGSYVPPTKEILEIVDNEHVHLELQVFEKDVMRIKKGQAIRFVIPEASNTVYNAEVHLVGAAIDETNRTIPVHGHLHGEERFLPGMFVNADIIEGSTKEMALPDEAVITLENGSYVLKLLSQDGDKFTFKKVKIVKGDTSNGFIAIKNSSDFDINDQFLQKGAFTILAE